MAITNTNVGLERERHAQILTLSPDDYTVGWICAIPVELQAARAMLDQEHAPLQTQPNYDENSYILGSVGAHNVIIACLPEYGNSRAAIAAKSMQATFRNLRFGLMVGVGGGIPSAKHDIRLGDVVISKPTGQGGGIIQYDIGRKEQDGFHRIGSMNKPPTLLRNTVVNLESKRGLGKQISERVNDVFGSEIYRDDAEEEWTYPVRLNDLLFKSEYCHIGDDINCNKCLEGAADVDGIMARDPRPDNYPRLHYGNIGSGNSVIKQAADREHLAKRDNVICFEMEAAGLMDDFPCLVIRGICDYADSHKNKEWQPYAAAVAVSYAKEYLAVIPPPAVRQLEPAGTMGPSSISQTASLGPVNFTRESTARLVISNYDYSMIKFPPPVEFEELGRSLSSGRRKMAEDGSLHTTARRLAAIFGPLLPQTPTVISKYGLRASEIAKASTGNLPDGIGFLSRHAGIDGTSIWAGATSGAEAVQVHLLACMLARMWTGPEATSIWVELLEARQVEVQRQLENSGSIDFRILAASKNQISRSQLAEWDASARAWLSIADRFRYMQQKQLLLVLGNKDGHVNSKPVVYESVIKTWVAGLKAMECLVLGSPMVMQTGELSVALLSWHIYPDLNILDPTSRVITQRDPLVPESGILTIGLEGPKDCENKGIRWSLPLAHLRYYGDPVRRTSTITSQGTRLSILEFNMAFFGCILGGWRVDDCDIEKVAEWISRLSADVHAAFTKLKIPLKQSWLYYLGDTARAFLKSDNVNRRVFLQLINLGRSNLSFLGKPSLPFFGLSEVNIAIAMAADTEEKIRILRTQASLAKLSWQHTIIRYVPNETVGEEYASASLRGRERFKRDGDDQPKVSAGHTRWIYSESRWVVPTLESMTGSSALVGQDVFAGAQEPGTEGYQWPGPQSATHRSEERSKIFTIRQAQCLERGESVEKAEKEPLQSVQRAGMPRRVIWGNLGLHPHSTLDAYDHWFGESKHYEYWLGDPESAALFLRIDQAQPEGDARVPFAELRTMFDQNAAKRDSFVPVLRAALGLLEPSYVESLRAFSSMNLLYESSPQSTVDVRVLGRSLKDSKWVSHLIISGQATNYSNAPVQRVGEAQTPNSTASATDDGGSLDPKSPIASNFEDSMYFDMGPEPESMSFQPHLDGMNLLSLEAVALKLKPWEMSTEESFSCILWFENTFDIFPTQLKSVMAISSGNSLFIAASLLCDPAAPVRKNKIRHVLGNIGRPETALLVPPIEPRLMKLGIERWPELVFSPWDGIERDSFKNSSLHLWFTGSTQEVDIGFSGAQDKELYILESVVSLHGNGTWIGDLDILKAAQNQSLVYRHRPNPASETLLEGGKAWTDGDRSCHELPQTCSRDHKKNYEYEQLPLAAIENWSELLENRNQSSIFLAKGNWQARLAAMMICIAQKRQVCLVSGSVCWECIAARRRSQRDFNSAVIYIF
ncbi:hypothetical protein PWT90_07848 [Aphanocladium album]|nr:hypothetical protein PWT90_07848 [Aphanocladium album]